MRKHYNYLGKQITRNKEYVPVDEKYFDESGKPRYDKWIQHGDQYGFDKRYRDENGRYVSRIILPKGKKIVRYGDNNGSYSTDYGIDYYSLSLPYKKESMPYHEYYVVKDCEVDCIVDKGVAAPGFSSKGGGIQYRHYVSIHDSIMDGVLKEDFKWISK